MQSHKFIYTGSRKISYWGIHYDSLLELKYALSIQDDYAFLRSAVPIFYHPSTLTPTLYVREVVRRYTPDFLIRHTITNEAFLVEIKPRAAEQDPKLRKLTTVAERYIKWKGYDWKFIVVFDDMITLDAHNLAIYEDCCRLQSKKEISRWLKDEQHRYKRCIFVNSPSESEKQFILFGNRQQA